jgi:hypothetical protein
MKVAKGAKAEIDRLQTKYLAASIEERARLLPELVQKFEEVFPRAVEINGRLIRDGSVLEAQFRHCLNYALARSDLSIEGKTDAMDDALVFFHAFKVLSDADPVAKEAAFQLALSALLVGLRTKPGPSGLEQLRAEFGRLGGKKGSEGRKERWPWRPHAEELALEAYSKDPDASNETLATEVVSGWKHERPKCPKHGTLSKYMSELRVSGVLPQRSRSLRN